MENSLRLVLELWRMSSSSHLRHSSGNSQRPGFPEKNALKKLLTLRGLLLERGTRDGTLSGGNCVDGLQMGQFIMKQAEPPLKLAILTTLSPAVFFRWNRDSNSTIC